MNVDITFIGGPLDRTRITIDGPVPPFWRHAETPKLGPMYSPPVTKEYLKMITSDYQIRPIHQGRKTVYVGLLMEVE